MRWEKFRPKETPHIKQTLFLCFQRVLKYSICQNPSMETCRNPRKMVNVNLNCSLKVDSSNSRTWQRVSRAFATGGRLGGWLAGVSGAEDDTLVGVGTVGGVFDFVRIILNDGSEGDLALATDVGNCWGRVVSVWGMCQDTPCWKRSHHD